MVLFVSETSDGVLEGGTVPDIRTEAERIRKKTEQTFYEILMSHVVSLFFPSLCFVVGPVPSGRTHCPCRAVSVRDECAQNLQLSRIKKRCFRISGKKLVLSRIFHLVHKRVHPVVFFNGYLETTRRESSLVALGAGRGGAGLL